MPRVIFMCGPAGSGKSTVARRLEAQGMARLSFDQEAWARGERAMPLTAEVHHDIDQHLRRRLRELVMCGRDVVLDFSFWSRTMREDWRGVLAPLGVTAETIYLATDRRTALARVQARRAEDGDAFPLRPEVAARYYDSFQPPTPDEGPLTVVGASEG